MPCLQYTTAPPGMRPKSLLSPAGKQESKPGAQIVVTQPTTLSTSPRGGLVARSGAIIDVARGHGGILRWARFHEPPMARGAVFSIHSREVAMKLPLSKVLSHAVLSCLVFAAMPVSAAEPSADWSGEQAKKLPKSEKPVYLFNGKDLTGWEGQIEKYWSVEDGAIVGRNDQDNAPVASTYLVTKDKYRNFRLIFEGRLVTSEMHTGIALWGKTVEKSGDPHSYEGHLVMFPSGYGFYDLYRRNSIYKDADGVAKRAGQQHEWNRMEILAIGDRIRHVINGVPVADWTDPKPELCGTGPIGLQLHSNKVPQEVQFRGLVLTVDPEDQLITVKK